MERKDEIKIALYTDFKKGDELKTFEIKECVSKHYPEIPKNSILPSDFCCNSKTKDPFSGKYHIFKILGYGSYELL
ncbi:MAG: hypothetical protein WCS03_01180 [Bacteroidota bacterium]